MTDLHHRVDGPEHAPVLVPSNPLGTDLTLWEPQLPALAARFERADAVTAAMEEHL